MKITYKLNKCQFNAINPLVSQAEPENKINGIVEVLKIIPCKGGGSIGLNYIFDYLGCGLPGDYYARERFINHIFNRLDGDKSLYKLLDKSLPLSLNNLSVKNEG